MVGKRHDSDGDSDEGNDRVACDDYRIDMTAASFGTCKCGRPKSEHNLLQRTTTSFKPKAKAAEELTSRATSFAHFGSKVAHTPPAPTWLPTRKKDSSAKTSPPPSSCAGGWRLRKPQEALGRGVGKRKGRSVDPAHLAPGPMEVGRSVASSAHCAEHGSSTL